MQHYRDGTEGRSEVALTAGGRKEVHSAMLLKQLDIFDVCWDDPKHYSSGQRLILQVWLSIVLNASMLHACVFHRV